MAEGRMMRTSHPNARRAVGARTAGAIAVGLALLALASMPPRLAAVGVGGQDLRGRPAPPSPWAEFVEPDFPFFSSVLDARAAGMDDNLTARGLILNLGHGFWACFDTDLLRVAAIWTGAGVTPVGMAQGSYHVAGAKAPEGQGTLPKIAGTLIAGNGLYPAWQIDRGGQPPLVDPRPAAPDPRELARGPLDPAAGRFRAVRLTSDGVVLEYEAHGASIQERITASADAVQRYFRIEGGIEPLVVVIGRLAAGMLVTESVPVSPRPYEFGIELTERTARDLTTAAAPTARTAGETTTAVANDAHLPRAPTTAVAEGVRHGSDPGRAQAAGRWPQTVTTRGELAPDGAGAFVVDRIPLPTGNPWRRNVRLADIGFLGDGRAAAVTFDGDVWTIDGLDGDLREVTWRRFASGLHEPLGLAVRNGEIFVFDRHGIWQLRDTDGNGEADRHEMFANGFAQTAETREFAMSIRTAPDGSFVIAKGGQEGTSIGRDNGSVLRVSADGTRVEKLGYGLRQPFASVDPRTGLVLASDQQGNYVPSTPLQIIRDGRYYGFIPLILPKEQYPAPIADPLLWIPHPISASAAGQVWLSGARMGPLSDGLVLLSYYRPAVSVVRLTERASRLQAASVTLTGALDFAPLAGAVNPADGQLYITGFQIWGTQADSISGLARVRYTGAPGTLPREIVPMTEGVLLRFDEPLDRRVAADPANYAAERWNYRRSAEYGSPHFRLDGTKGQDAMVPSSAYVSLDGKSVFVGIPGMQPVMQMRIAWSLQTQAGEAFEQNAYLTPYALVRFEPATEGFDRLTVNLAPRAGVSSADLAATAENGRRIAARAGCLGCHSIDGTMIGRIGPTWKGLLGSERTFSDRSTTVADEPYVRQSILEPSARIVNGFNQSEAGMPSYAGVLTPAEIDAVIAYIRSLR
jgi:glucose/arabinose dehydrogenase/mono/diheme cytochrome c family protein